VEHTSICPCKSSNPVFQVAQPLAQSLYWNIHPPPSAVLHLLVRIFHSSRTIRDPLYLFRWQLKRLVTSPAWRLSVESAALPRPQDKLLHCGLSCFLQTAGRHSSRWSDHDINWGSHHTAIYYFSKNAVTLTGSIGANMPFSSTSTKLRGRVHCQLFLFRRRSQKWPIHLRIVS
jgi:hypothetical protein